MTMTAMTEIAHETGIDETESDPATGDAVEATGAVPDPADAAGLDANRPEGTDAGHANDEAVGAVADDAATGETGRFVRKRSSAPTTSSSASSAAPCPSPRMRTMRRRSSAFMARSAGRRARMSTRSSRPIP